MKNRERRANASAPAPPSSAPPREARLSTRLLTAAALAATALLFYGRLLSPDVILLQRDAFRMQVPLRQYLVDRLARGEFPLWFPFDALGRPYVDVGVTAVFHPFTLLFLIAPPLVAYKLCVIACGLLGAFGNYWLARRLGASRVGGVLAGAGLALSGYVASLSDNLQYLYPVCALPVFLAALDRALAESRRGMLALAAVVWASAFLIGDPQAGMIFGGLGVVWALMRGPSGLARRLGQLGIAAAGAALVAAVQLVPLWFALRDSSRGGAGLPPEVAERWAETPARLLALIAGWDAGAHGLDPLTMALTGAPFAWARSIYVGLPVMGLALLAAARDRRRLWPLAAAALALLLLAMGPSGGLYPLARALVPFWSAFRYPEKLLGAFTVLTAALAGVGLDILRSGRSPRLPWLLAAASCGAAAALAAQAAGGDPAALSAAVRALSATAAVAALVTLAASLALRRRAAVAAAVGVLVLAALDLARVNFHAYRTGPAELARETPPFVHALESREGPLRPGSFRVATFDRQRLVAPGELGELLGQDCDAIAGRTALDALHNATFGIESALAYLPAESSAFKGLLLQQPKPEMLGRYNVKYIVDSAAELRSDGWAPQFVAELPRFDLALALNPAAVRPRAYLSPQVERIAPGSDWKALARRPEFASGPLDFIEDSASRPGAPGGVADGMAVIVKYEPERVTVQTEASSAAVLVLNDAFDEGWSARLEGGEALRVLRANFLVRAVEVPAGTHRVTFRYSGARVAAGALVSLAGLGLLFGYGLSGLRRRSKRDVASPA